jgi:hypothetical protein
MSEQSENPTTALASLEVDSSREKAGKSPSAYRLTPALCLLLLCSATASVGLTVALVFGLRHSIPPPPPPYSYEWSGFGCDRQCARGDVNFVMEARLKTYKLPGSGAKGQADTPEDASMYTRTWVGTEGPFCELGSGTGAYDGSSGPVGPCLTANPGQMLTIRIVNQLDRGMELLRQRKVEKNDYWLQTSTQYVPVTHNTLNATEEYSSGAELDEIQVGPGSRGSTGWIGVPPKTAEGMTVTNPQDMPVSPARIRLQRGRANRWSGDANT